MLIALHYKAGSIVGVSKEAMEYLMRSLGEKHVNILVSCEGVDGAIDMLKNFGFVLKSPLPTTVEGIIWMEEDVQH